MEAIFPLYTKFLVCAVVVSTLCKTVERKGEKKHKSDFKFEENISLYQTSLLHHCINGLDFLLLWCYSVNQIVGAFGQDIYIYIFM